MAVVQASQYGNDITNVATKFSHDIMEGLEENANDPLLAKIKFISFQAILILTIEKDGKRHPLPFGKVEHYEVIEELTDQVVQLFIRALIIDLFKMSSGTAALNVVRRELQISAFFMKDNEKEGVRFDLGATQTGDPYQVEIADTEVIKLFP